MSTFLDTIKSIPGLTHYYPLDAAHQAADVIGGKNGTVHGNVKFAADGAHFDGASSIELPDSDDFSVTKTKELTIVAFLTVEDWTRVSHNHEYLHWMGKGKPGAHEWVFRTYIDGGGGEAPQRKRRISFYHFVPSGGLGTGSFVQDPDARPGVEQMISGTITTKGTGSFPGEIKMYKNGVLKDTDQLTAYKTIPANTASAVFLGTRGDNTGFLVGRLHRVAFFNRVLSAAELAKLYDARTSPEVTAPGHVSAPVDTQPITQVVTTAHPPTGNLAAVSALRARAGELRKMASELDALADDLST